ncbi:ribonuclease HI/probable phosphoglycerate mutase [Saccharothrix carnea]|uniref:Ribonuclease HI/probable phosphoglycerate mutase n=1 Tax=Saccharothrix carnea TaxID=1280637 RepID=A0A2P8I7K8_SACCR|nr:bifunctional RNase H/acid phosphatase [Saccharothrix carnea]PSL54455.1 ribonuclease HI/probable phosphoglycerate mutase [Saccharothrix carnea]
MKVLVEADGGSRGNPGPAGYGAVVLDAAGAVLAERSEGIGVATNNVAEYRGLIAGLRAAAELGASEVDVRMDSKLVVEQMSGRWKVKHPSMQPLVAEAREVARAFDRVGYTWIPRERNQRADRLANLAMDDQAGVPRKEQAQPEKAVRPEPRQPDAATQSPVSWTGAVGEPTRLYLLRHGQTELSVARRYSGRGNPPLTEVGRGQAEAAARRLAKVEGLDAVVSSPLGRARETARAVASATGAELTWDDDLIETDFGAWEGLTFAEAAERDPDVHRRWLGDPSVPAPGGESFEQVHHRVRRARNAVVSRFGGANVVVVSHVTPIKCLLRMALDVGPSLLFRLHLDLASLSVVEFYPDGHASVRLVNDTSHLG